MVYIAYYTKLIPKFAITRRNVAFVAKIVNMRLTEVFMAISALAEGLPTSATLLSNGLFCHFKNTPTLEMP